MEQKLVDFLSKLNLEYQMKIWYPIPSYLGRYISLMGMVSSSKCLQLITDKSLNLLLFPIQYLEKVKYIQNLVLFILLCNRSSPMDNKKIKIPKNYILNFYHIGI